METKVAQFKGYHIFYDDRLKSFIARNADGDEIAKGKSQTELEEKLAKMVKQAFKPIKAFKIEAFRWREVEVTSLNPDEKTVWFVYRDDISKYSSGRSKLSLRYDRIYEATEANIVLFVKVKALNDQIKAIEAEIENLKEQLGGPINLEYFGLKDHY